MRVAIITLVATAAMTTAAFAANGAPAQGHGLPCWALIAFCAAVVVGQTIPAVKLVMGANGLITPPKATNQK